MKLVIDKNTSDKLVAMFSMAYRSRWVAPNEDPELVNDKLRLNMRYRTRKEIFASPKRG